MGGEETKTEVPEATENGTTSLSEKPTEAMADEKEVKEDDGVKEMEEDKKADEQAQAEKMDEDSEVKEDKETKEKENTKEEKEAEEVKYAKEEEEKEEDQEKEEPKTETVEEENVANEKEVTDEQEGSKEDVKEKVSEDEEQKAEETKKVKRASKRVKVKSGGKKAREKKSKIEEKKEPEQRTPPAVDRPVRERKSVERLVASIEKDSSRELHIRKGRGTPLKDIPNVAFKLSRRKTDDMFRLLHSILFGRRGKAFQVKSNISHFSGFVWHENEEKQKIKVKEKFDKCNKEKLLEFCDVLDIPISKTTMRKEDIVVSLIDFLVAPHATSTVLLAEKESNKSKKRKRVAKHNPSTADSTLSKYAAKSRRKTGNASKMEKKSSADTDDESEEEEEENEEKENGVPKKSEDEMPEQSESEDKNVSEDESEEDVGKRKHNTKASKKESGGKARTKKITVSTKSSPPPKRTPKKAPSKHSKVDEDSDTSPKVFSRKKKNEVVTMEKTSTPTKSTPKEKPGKMAAKGKEKAKAEKSLPTDEKLRDAICEILKEVDFNTATFTDILKQLAQQFDTDLTSRKSSIKLMIQEELTKLADEAEDEDGEGDAEKDETLAGSQEVEA